MSRDLRLYLQDILDSIEKIKRYIANVDQTEFAKDEKTFEAIVYNLQIIGEAAKHIPESDREIYTQINWREVVGLRNVISHAYFSLDENIIWDIIQSELGGLADCVRHMKEHIDNPRSQ